MVSCKGNGSQSSLNTSSLDFSKAEIISEVQTQLAAISGGDIYLRSCQRSKQIYRVVYADAEGR
jgi:hypothetical protein